MRKYNEDSDDGLSLESDVVYTERLHKFCNDLPFVTKRMKIREVEQLVSNFYDKEKFVTDIRNLKITKSWIGIWKIAVIKFSQDAQLKP